ncbi:hypothetical protein STENM327S_02348 [Streptomyces tendae]
MDQPLARQRAAAAREPSVAGGADVWESDLSDLAGLPLTAVDGLVPLRPTARLLEEVLRSRGGVRGGQDGQGGARAE